MATATVDRYKWRAAFPDESVHVAVNRPRVGWVTLCGIRRTRSIGFELWGRDFSPAVTCSICLDPPVPR